MSTTGLPDMPVLLAHGWGGSYAQTWSASALEATLRAAGRPIIAVDLPGHGSGNHSHDPEDYADISDKLLKDFADTAVVDAIGYSLGGKLLLALAVRYPHRFRRLVIAGVGDNLFRPENGELIASAVAGKPERRLPAAVKSIVDAALASGNDPHALSAVIRRPPSTLTPIALSAIAASVLLVAGGDDVFIGDVTLLQAAIEDAQLCRLPGVDHMATAASPDFQRAAADFILKAAASAGRP